MSGITSSLLLLGIVGTFDQPPDGWYSEAPRPEIAPIFRVERIGAEPSSGTYLLVQEGRGDAAVDGRWLRTVSVKAAGYYEFAAEYEADNVAGPERSVLRG